MRELTRVETTRIAGGIYDWRWPGMGGDNWGFFGGGNDGNEPSRENDGIGSGDGPGGGSGGAPENYEAIGPDGEVLGTFQYGDVILEYFEDGSISGTVHLDNGDSIGVFHDNGAGGHEIETGVTYRVSF